jgi:hypothetical protein
MDQRELQEIKENILAELSLLDDNERFEVFESIQENYCLSCGIDNPECQCWNDG